MSRRSGVVVRRDWGDDEADVGILHVDMDAFFASVELVRRPELRGRPVIVGGEGRSVVLAATYEARAFGVHSAMPMAQARRLCPQAVVVPPDRRAYEQASRRAMAVLGEVTALVEQVSVDEAFLDVTGARRRLGPPTVIGELIRRRVRAEVGVTCSVGVAATKVVAKLASGFAKPDGLLLVPRAATVPFLQALPVAALWGVGDRTREALERWGITTVEQLAATDVRVVQRAVGTVAGAHLHDLAWGRDPRTVDPQRPEKSVGAETTLERDSADVSELEGHLLRLADRCATQLRAKGHVCRTVSLKVRTDDFRTLTRSRTLPVATDVGWELYLVARELLAAADLRGTPVRLVGVRAEGLGPATERPLTLEEAVDESPVAHRRAEAAMDAVRARFGSSAVRPAALVDQPARPGAPEENLRDRSG
ncbi:DNA polymerase IV [Actinotalea sp. Marseille-Q4924]|uniref:DNA polymerase IV n=1 Tax=Actinotalea sp. Marseille-Q4924 TaxID=2866571 RepID=UPI001CE4B612|nr:DNA polymerase IV [Actinotalea sp. Marseille-Q4924]